MTMIERIKALGANKFLRSVAILTGGTLAGQVIIILALPFLTRLYAPTDFGMLAVYASLIGVLSVAACLRFDIAVMIPDKNADAINLLALALVFATLVFVVLMIGTIFWAGPITTLIKQPEIAPYLWMVALGVWLASLYSAMRYWSMRQKRFADVAKTQLTRAIGGVGTQLGIGVVQAAPFGLLFGQMIYGGLGTLGLLVAFLRAEGRMLGEIKLAVMRRKFVEYRKYPIFSVPESLLNAAASNIPVILIASMASLQEAGFFITGTKGYRGSGGVDRAKYIKRLPV